MGWGSLSPARFGSNGVRSLSTPHGAIMTTDPARLTLLAVPGSFAVCQLPPGSPVPAWATAGPLFSVTRTPDELSVVCDDSVVPNGVTCETGWRAVRVAGSMPFTLVGVLAALTAAVASAGVGVFAFSTFDTDYLLVKAENWETTLAALRSAGHTINDDPHFR